jgi:hypothetical protein
MPTIPEKVKESAPDAGNTPLLPDRPCHRCGSSAPPLLKWQQFADRSRHIRAECAACGVYHGYVALTPDAVAIADQSPEPGIRPDQPSLWDVEDVA